MIVFPQCYGGIMPPFVNAFGQVLPCCMHYVYGPTMKDIDNNTVKNPFTTNPNFNVINKPLLEIINSQEWKEMLSNIGLYKSQLCNYFCSSEKNKVTFTPDNKPYVYGGSRQDILQLELTNMCTLKCLYCSRLSSPYKLNKQHLSLDVAWRVISEKKWDKFIDCAIYGDPIWYEHLEDLLKLMIKKPSMKEYNISTAATGRGKDYWEKIIKLWGQLYDRGVKIDIYFGIDGSERTSKLHRINQDWDEITYALQYTASNTGIVPTLQFIPFIWNQHEIDEMMLMAEKWKAKFVIKKSQRFAKHDKNKPDKHLYVDYNNGREKPFGMAYT